MVLVRCILTQKVGRANGLGGAAQALGVVRVPTAMGGVCGIIEYTDVASDPVPPLTPVGLLSQIGGVIDIFERVVLLRKSDFQTCFTPLKTGHLQHCILEFPPGGWSAPSREAPEEFRVDPSSPFVPMRFASSASLFVVGSVCGRASSASFKACSAASLACPSLPLNAWASYAVCERHKGGCGAFLNYTPTERALESRRKKAEKKVGTSSFSSAASRIVSGEAETSEIPECPRCQAPMSVYDPKPGVKMPFWRCSAWPSCRVLGNSLPGTIEVVQYLKGHAKHVPANTVSMRKYQEAADEAQRLGELLSTLVPPAAPPQRRQPPTRCRCRPR